MIMNGAFGKEILAVSRGNALAYALGDIACRYDYNLLCSIKKQIMTNQSEFLMLFKSAHVFVIQYALTRSLFFIKSASIFCLIEQLLINILKYYFVMV